MSINHPNPILAKLRSSGEFSDLKIICNGQEFRVHKAVVCLQSPMFKAAAQGGFKESDTNVIPMNTFQPTTVRRLVQFMYTGDYNDEHEDEYENPDQNIEDDDNIMKEDTIRAAEKSSEPGENQDEIGNASLTTPLSESEVPSIKSASASLIEHIRVNSIGDYCGIDQLVSLANSKIEALLENSRDQTWIASLPTATELAVRSTGDVKVVDILASAAGANISRLLDSNQFKTLDLTTDYWIKVLQRCAQDFVALEIKYLAMKWEHLESEEAARDLRTELRSLKRCLEVLNRTSGCRNCSVEFMCTIDPDESLLRCGKCRCKHYG